jgi:endonuclease/exonuclease/phosphatase (EEP) superfamily protein YafD
MLDTRRCVRCCCFFLVAGMLGVWASAGRAEMPLLPPAIDGDLRDWDVPPGSPVGLVTCADRLYLRITLPEPVVLQDNGGVVIYYDIDDDVTSGLSAHGLGAEIRWNAGLRSGTAYTMGPGGLTSRSLSHADLELRAAPVHDSTDFELSIRRPEAGVVGACRVAVEWNGELLGVASATYREERVVRSLSPARAPHTDLRVLAYNVENDRFPGNNTLRPQFFAEFEVLQPDVICFTEIYNHSAETTRIRVAEVLPYMLYASGEGRTVSSTPRDSRLVSRHPILFSETNGRFHGARIRSEDGSIDAMIITAHLSCCSNDGLRAQQLQDIKDLVGRLRAGQLPGVPANLPVILAGDLNLVRWDTPAFLALQQGTGLRPLPALHLDTLEDYTWRRDSESFSPGRLDYILAGPGLVARRAFVYKSSNPPSDHLPLVADLAIDADGNGLADAWERFYFGQVGQNPAADPDGDGFTNVEEQRTGTDPLDATDRPRLIADAIDGGWRLRMNARGPETAGYELWRSTDLTSWEQVPGRWQAGQSPLMLKPEGRAAFFRANLAGE